MLYFCGMQLQFPYYPRDTKMISDCVGVYENEGIVQYIVNGLPVYSHASSDMNAFRFITSNFICQGLCHKIDVQRCFGVSEDTVGRAVKKFKEQGESGFFGDDARKGRARIAPHLNRKIGGKRMVLSSDI